ncbi:MAG: phage tail protein [Actinomycetales bacterium]
MSVTAQARAEDLADSARPAPASPHPLLYTLPQVYRGDPVTAAFCTAIDEMLAPVIAILDTFDAYLDLELAPSDSLGWLAGWLGVEELDLSVPVPRQRELLRTMSGLQGWLGTARGIALIVETLIGLPTEVVETGGARWSRDPTDALPGEPVAALVVRVRANRPDRVDSERLDAIVRAVKPAHVIHRVLVVPVESASQAEAPSSDEE